MIDFGLASRLSQETRALVPPNRLPGRVAYISPEQTGRMNRVVDYRTDVYSLGATLYHLLTGVPPFESDDPLALVHWHIARQPIPPHERHPRRAGDRVAPGALAMIVRAGLTAPLDGKKLPSTTYRLSTLRVGDHLRERLGVHESSSLTANA